jgi:hypothetical protein
MSTGRLHCVSTPSATEPRIFAVNRGRVWPPMQTTSAFEALRRRADRFGFVQVFERLDFRLDPARRRFGRSESAQPGL